MSFTLSRSSLPSRVVVVLLAGLLAVGLLSGSAQAGTPTTAPGRVGGLVLDRSNQPLPGATLTFTHTSGALAGSTAADDHGRWSLAVPQDDYDVEVSAQQGDHTLSAEVRRYAVGEDTKLNLILVADPTRARVAAAATTESGAVEGGASPTFTRASAATTQSSDGRVTFSGQVFDADGQPVADGIDVWLNQPQTYWLQHFPVAADGTFSLAVPTGVYTLGVLTGVQEDDCPGCPVERTPLSEHNYLVENFRLDGDRHQTIRLPRPASLPVAVVDPAGRPVAQAWVGTRIGAQAPTLSDVLFPGATTKVY
ncbi:MAG: carboxypeptidase-like regulatory domain-containing protein, partial [Actinobacteria bacterium]|nr:carboxypeptidase-like regulatory domain-containing protein [Actinomycetota bacterium]